MKWLQGFALGERTVMTHSGQEYCWARPRRACWLFIACTVVMASWTPGPGRALYFKEQFPLTIGLVMLHSPLLPVE